MTRFATALTIALCLASSPLYAQSPRFTVTAPSASVYQAPSAASPVIAQCPKGSVLVVRAEADGWVEVVWPNAAKGIAYLRTTTGLQRPMTIDEFVHDTTAPRIPGAMTADASNPSAAYVADAVQAVAAASTQRPTLAAAPAASPYVAPAHFVGLGGRMAARTSNLGATGRVWSRSGMGVQFELLRNATRDAVTAERVTSMQLAPSVLMALPNAVSDYIWIRPYVGGGPTLYRSTTNSLGIQLFGGGEVTFAGVPRFALSADAGYRKIPAAFTGFDRRKIRLALSGHWFVR